MTHVLMVYWHPPGVGMRATVNRHIHVLDGRASHVHYHNAFEPFPRAVRRRRYAAIVLHNTFLCMRWSDEFARYAIASEWIGERRCAKIAMPQDEYDHHEILDEWLYALGVEHVFTNFGEDTRATLYPLMARKAEFTEVLTGYIDENDLTTPPTAANIESRRLDIAYRSSDLPYWFGSQGRLKVEIGAAADRYARRQGLACDISSRPEDTLFGSAWREMLSASRSIVGCETGSSVLDHRGEIQAAIRKLQEHDPDIAFEGVAERMPAGWDDHHFFAIGPRHLEAVAAGTVQILVEGDYSGVLAPDIHYIPVRRDLSDLDAAIDRLADTSRLTELAQQAYADVCASGRYTYARLADLVGRAVGGG